MKRIIVFILIICPFLFSQAQLKIKNKKYPSLMWAITGNGLKKPSYLFGTMHVSSKIAFHLSDSFYLALQNADVVALETNPESWQEDLTKYETENPNYASPWKNFSEIPNDYLTMRSLQFPKFEKQVEQALFVQPSTINNLLYRNYSDYSSDFEEDTYLDMYIYQVGKKMGKRVAGVERYEESMQLMMEAYKDAALDKNKKEKSYDVDEGLAPDKIQEAYRTGNLDLLDSINRLNSFSDAFDEKFLYKRNAIQAGSIDSILKTRSSLFVGVGAAHLPGYRGVIETLRRKGYTLRPVMMGERDSRHKEQVEKIRVPVTFNTQTALDSFFKVDIPGKLYRFNENGFLNQQQYADMANGSYYIITRVKTNSFLWGYSAAAVYKKVDSVLYENIPGRIITREAIVRNGYKGFNIVNRTRRGDIQRYNIFITPYEILFFKMSGNGDYVKEGVESAKFFNSIQLKEIREGGWKKFEPSYGGFSVDFPHTPFESIDNNRQFDAEDKATATHFTVMRTDVHNYHFAEEDTFDLALMEESFASSAFIDKSVSKKQVIYKGYPALNATYTHTDGSEILARFIIQGPHYYTLVTKSKRENPLMENFLNSFEIKPFIYGPVKARKDTSLYYTVQSPVFPEEKKQKLDIPSGYTNRSGSDDDDGTETEVLNGGTYRNAIIASEATGEKIFVSFFKMPRYYYNKDSTGVEEDNEKSFLGDDTSWIVRSKKKYELPGKMKAWEYLLSDTNSSRTIQSKTFYKNGIGFVLVAEGDTLTAPSSFIRNFFATFSPSDTLTGINPFQKKSGIFFADFFSGDSMLHKGAVKAIDNIELDASDLPMLKRAISSISWSDKNYLDIKKSFIDKLGDINSKASSDYLKELYFAAGDTIELQYSALQSLLQHQTQHAFAIFGDIIALEPPVLETGKDAPGDNWSQGIAAMYLSNNDYSRGSFLAELYDSLKLTRTILPQLLPLLNLDDYKWDIMRLLSRMIDSNLVKGKDYETYLSKFLIEAKQELKKQLITEKKRSIEKAMSKESRNPAIVEDEDNGNDNLSIYATLLLPFSENVAIPPLFQQLLRSNDKRLKYNTMLLLIRNRKSVPDTLANYFAALDEYRYELYTDLKIMKMGGKFPATFNNHPDLARSRLLNSKAYKKPDSLVYLDKIRTNFEGKTGFIYYFKYKQKKDDADWKLATVGLIPEDASQFEFDEKSRSVSTANGYHKEYSKYDFTEFTDTKLSDDDPLAEQLNKAQKKMLYARRKSGKEFYEKNEDSVFGAFRNGDK